MAAYSSRRLSVVACLMHVLFIPASSILVTPSSPPKGWNSFDLQFDQRYNNSIPVWNETYFRKVAPLMAKQLLPHGYDTIVIDGGWSSSVDSYGRPIPDPTRWPSAATGGFSALADWTHKLGLKFGIWTLRGVTPLSVSSKLPIFGAVPPTTIDEVAFGEECWNQPTEHRWCNCTWDKDGVGLNASHPAALTYYKSLVDLYASWGVDFIKWDCMYENADSQIVPHSSYGAEELLAVQAVRDSSRELVLSLSPGGGMAPDSAAWVAGMPDGYAPPDAASKDNGVKATMYRITGDFHSESEPWSSHLQDHVFVIGNITDTARGKGKGLIGVNNTWPDSDMIDLGRDSEFFGKPSAQLHAVIWMMSRSPLMFAGDLPITDSETLNYLTNPLALAINAKSTGLQVRYEGDCSCKIKNAASGHACMPYNDPHSEPCVATWWSKLGDCTALAVLNIGNKTTSKPTSVSFDSIGITSSKVHATYVYEGTEEDHLASIDVAVPALGGKMLVLSANANGANSCLN